MITWESSTSWFNPVYEHKNMGDLTQCCSRLKLRMGCRVYRYIPKLGHAAREDDDSPVDFLISYFPTHPCQTRTRRAIHRCTSDPEELCALVRMWGRAFVFASFHIDNLPWAMVCGFPSEWPSINGQLWSGDRYGDTVDVFKQSSNYASNKYRKIIINHHKSQRFMALF